MSAEAIEYTIPFKNRVTLRPKEFWEAAGFSRSKFWKLVSEGKIKTFKNGNMTFVPVNELERFAAGELH
ncbi:hypothetical protein [Elstera sp.]|jgi:hypothetical protein|uniref:hypothetical protein n=1 Tax=Elstera sp. TaxID=1916664 RepID=UPI0037BFADD2